MIVSYYVEDPFEALILKSELELSKGTDGGPQLRELLAIKLSCKALYFARGRVKTRILRTTKTGSQKCISSLPSSEMVKALTTPKNGMPGFENTVFFLTSDRYDDRYTMPSFMKTKVCREQVRFLRFEVDVGFNRQSSMLQCIRPFRRLKEVILTLHINMCVMNPTDLYFVIAPICAFESQLKDELTPWVTMDAGVRQG